MHMQGKLLENRNKMLKAQGINETLFMALITLESQENHSIQPSELSCALGSSRTNATRIADELEKRGWIERRESDNDRRCLHLQLTDKGHRLREGAATAAQLPASTLVFPQHQRERPARAHHPQTAHPPGPDGRRRRTGGVAALTRTRSNIQIDKENRQASRSLLAFLINRSAQPMKIIRSWRTT
jgi:DNA-binding MarR family transcriptional regulator